MEKLTKKEFRGVSQRIDDIDSPIVFAETCKDVVLTYLGKIKKRSGYATATLNGVTFTTTGLSGNILNIFEFVTGRDTTTAPNEAKRYLAMTDNGTGEVYLLDESIPSWSKIDNDVSNFADNRIRFFVLNNMLRTTGNNTETGYPLLWGYRQDKFVKSLTGTAGSYEQLDGGFMSAMVQANAPKPQLTDAISTIAAVQDNYNGLGFGWGSYITREAGNYLYRIAVQYDYTEWSMPSDETWFITTIADDSNRAYIRLRFNESVFNDRITAVRIYRTKVNPPNTDTYGADDNTFYFVKEISVDQDWETVFIKDESATYDSATGDIAILPANQNDMYIADDIYNYFNVLMECDEGTFKPYALDTVESGQKIKVATGLGTMTNLTITVKAGWRNVSNIHYYAFFDVLTDDYLGQEMYTNLGYGRDISIDCNYKYHAVIDDQLFVGNVWFNGAARKNRVMYSLLNNSDGNYAYDVFHPLNLIQTPFEINGMAALTDRLFIFGRNKINRGIVPTSNYATWDFDKAYTDFGLLAENSIVSTEHGRIYFLGSDFDVKELDASVFKSIGHDIYDYINDTAISYLRSAVGVYYPKLKWYLLKFQYGSSSYRYLIYDTVYKTWYTFVYHITDINTELNLVAFCNGDDAELFAASSTTIYELNSGATDSGVSIDPEYKTIPVTSGADFLHMLFSFTPTYKSDTALDIDLFLDKSTTAETLNNSFPAHSLTDSIEANLPVGTNCRFFQFRVKINSTDLANNTVFEVNQLDFYFEKIVPRAT